MSTNLPWTFLRRKPRSLYRHLFIHDKGRFISARTVYGQAVGDDARTPEQLAQDYDLPLEAIREAIAYCESNPPEIAEDWAAEEALAEADGMNDPGYKYRARPRLLSPEEMARLNRI
jgi:uncharacterized protein (DUF433 family)